MLIENDIPYGQEDPIEEDDQLIASSDDEYNEDSNVEEYDGDQSQIDMDEPAYEVEIDGVSENIPLSKMKEMINASKKFAEVEPELNKYNEFKPILNKIGGSPMLKNAITYSIQGYSDDQIIDGLFLLKHPEVKEMYEHYSKNKPSQAEEMPEFDTIEEEVEYRVKKGIESHIAPIKAQLDGMTNQQQQAQQSYQTQQIYANNDALINSIVAEKYGDIPVTKENIEKLQTAFVGLGFGRTGQDITRTQLNKDQAEALLYKAYGAPNKRNSQPQFKDMSGLPSIMRGQTGHTSAGAYGQKRDNVYENSAQRKKAIGDLFDSL